jgi:outer membrane autotransporter protein
MQFSTMMDAGYIISMKSVNLTPMASLEYSRLMIGGYTEKGADSLDLTVKDQNYSLLQSSIGFRLDFTFGSELVKWTPEFHVKWLRDLVSDKQGATATFAGGGGSFKTEGYDTAPTALDLGGKMTMLTKENLSLSLNYDLLVKQGFYSHSGFAEVGVKW